MLKSQFYLCSNRTFMELKSIAYTDSIKHREF